MEQTTEVDGFLLIGSMGGIYFYQLCMSNDFLQALYAHLAQVFPYLLGQKREEVHRILGPSLEVFPEFGALRSHTHRAGIRITFPHHHAAQHNQRQRTKRELIGS